MMLVMVMMCFEIVFKAFVVQVCMSPTMDLSVLVAYGFFILNMWLLLDVPIYLSLAGCCFAELVHRLCTRADPPAVFRRDRPQPRFIYDPATSQFQVVG